MRCARSAGLPLVCTNGGVSCGHAPSGTGLGGVCSGWDGGYDDSRTTVESGRRGDDGVGEMGGELLRAEADSFILRRVRRGRRGVSTLAIFPVPR